MSMIVLLTLVLQKPNPPTHGMARMVPAGFCGSLLSRMKAIASNPVKAALCFSALEVVLHQFGSALPDDTIVPQPPRFADDAVDCFGWPTLSVDNRIGRHVRR